MIELLVVISVILILVSLLFPALRTARTKAGTISCVNNLSSIGKIWRMYLDSFDDNVPPLGSADNEYVTWQDYLYFHMGKWPVLKQKIAFYTVNDSTRTGDIITPRPPFSCPAQKICKFHYRRNKYFGGGNGPLVGAEGGWSDNLRRIRNPSRRMYIGEGVEASLSQDLLVVEEVDWIRHGGKRTNFLFLDGHVESSLPRQEIYELTSEFWGRFRRN